MEDSTVTIFGLFCGVAAVGSSRARSCFPTTQPAPVGLKNRIRLGISGCLTVIVMDDATQNISATNTPFLGDKKWKWGRLCEPLMWASRVVGTDVFSPHIPQVAPVQNEELVQALCAYRAHPALRHRFRSLPEDKRRLLWEMLESFERASGIPTPGDHVAALIQEVNHLRRKHPMFLKRRFSVKDEVGRMLGNVTRTTTPDLMLNDFLVPLLVGLFGHGAPDRARIETVVQHPDVTIVLNALLPRKEIPSSLAKLFWLMMPPGTLAKKVEAISPELQDGLKALWLLLDKVASS